MKSPSNWVNLQDYLGLNKEQGQDMAGKVTKQVGEEAQGAQDQLAAAQTTFDQKAKAGTNTYDPNATGTSADATAKANQGYTGPKDLGDVDPTLQNNVKNAADRVKAANTSEGQTQELGQAYAGKQAGGGLDSFLLSGAGGGAFEQLNSKYGTLGQTGAAANDAAITTGQQAAHESQMNSGLWNQAAGERKSKEDAAAAQAQSSADVAAMNDSWNDTKKDDWGRSLLEIPSVAGQIYGATQGGKKDPLERWLSQTFSGNSKDYGNIQWSSGHGALTNQADSKDVFSQMDERQWKELEGLRHQEQPKWIAKRAAELKNGTGAPRGKFIPWSAIKS